MLGTKSFVSGNDREAGEGTRLARELRVHAKTLFRQKSNSQPSFGVPDPVENGRNIPWAGRPVLHCPSPVPGRYR